MNYRHGFFRVWVVVSALWAVVVVSIWAGLLLDPHVGSKVYFYGKSSQGPSSAEPYGEDYRILEQFRASGDALAIELDLPTRPTLYLNPTLSRQEQDDRIEEVVGVEGSRYDREKTRKRLDSIPGVVGAIFLPPLVVFLTGWMIAWALSGFRTSRT